MADHQKSYSPSRVVERAVNDGTTRFRLTERKVDREGDVVESGGGRLDNFRANPIVLFAHGWHSTQSMLPVGRILPDSIKQTQKFIDANVQFHDSGSDPFSANIAEKVQSGFLNAGSIGFMPITIGKEPVLPKQTGITFLEWELLEFSIVPIPALATATARREFDAFAVKCAEYGCALDEELLQLIERKLDLQSGMENHVGLFDGLYVDDKELATVLNRDAVQETLNRLNADMELVKDVLADMGAPGIAKTPEQEAGAEPVMAPILHTTKQFAVEAVALQVALAEEQIRALKTRPRI